MKAKIASAIVFAIILLALPVATIIAPKSEFSEMENRTLASFPKLSLKTIADRSFMNGVETYFADHFIGRDFWVGVKGESEYISGKRENNGIFICDDRLIENLPEPDAKRTENNIEAIRKFVENNKKPTYLMLVPTAVSIYSDSLPYGAQTWDQREYISGVTKSLNGVVNTIDVYGDLYSNRNENIYYKTDHHWTTMGAYIAFKEAASRMGLGASAKNQYNINNVTHDFYGTLYSKAGYRNVSPDIISVFEKQGEQAETEVSVFNGMATETYNSMYFTEYLETKDKYRLFLGQNQPVVTIKTNAKTDKKIVLFKDSYAHCFVPFLADCYSEITMVDLRYINAKYTNFVNVEDYDHVLLLYNVDTFGQTNDITKLGW